MEHARAQLNAISEYISRDSPSNADGMVDRIVARLEQARIFPMSGRAVPEWSNHAFRELIESPYRLIYQPRARTIDVLVIMHQRQRLEPPV